MKRRILSIITTMALVLPMMCAFNIVKPQTAQAESSTPVARANGVDYYSFDKAWAEAIKNSGTFKLLTNWSPSNKKFETNEKAYKDYFKSGALCVPEGKTVTIDLNGYSISRGLYYRNHEAVSDGEVIYLSKNAVLSINDTSPGGDGRIEDGNSRNGGGGIHAKSGSIIYMQGGGIAYCQSAGWWRLYDHNGSAVQLESGATMYMYGGKLYNNNYNPTFKYTTSEGVPNGGAVKVESNARFYMYGGEIMYNTAIKYQYNETPKSASKGTAIYSAEGGTVYLYGGKIHHNVSNYNKEEVGATVYCEGELYMQGTEIACNSAHTAVQNVNRAYFRGGSIHDNESYGIIVEPENDTYFGGNIVVKNGVLFGNYRKSSTMIVKTRMKTESFSEGANIVIAHPYHIDTREIYPLSDTEGSGKYARYFHGANISYGRVVNGSDGKLYYTCDWYNEGNFNALITGIASVKHGDSDITYELGKQDSDADWPSYNITIHVPKDTDVTNLAVSFTTSGTAESVTSEDSPKSGSVMNFTKPVTYTLLHRDGRTEQNWTITVVKDLEVPSYDVTVNSGTGSGNYTKGSKVSVAADEVENKRFISWTADGIELSSEQTKSPSITFTMPEKNVTLTANYEDLTSAVELTVDEPYGGRALDAYAAVKLSDGTEGEVPVNWSPMENEADFNSTYTAVVTFTSEYGFSSNLEVTFNGETVTPKKPDSNTLVITKEFTTGSPKLVSVPQAELTGVKNGTALENISLPSKVRIVTEDKSISTAYVAWDKTTAAEYDPKKEEEQTFTVGGTITLPEGIDQNGVALDAKIKVTVSASGIAAAPTSNLVNGAVYDKQQTLELTSADGADIYYTTDGTEPTASSQKYNGAITLAADSKTDKVYTIKAIAAGDSLSQSEVSEFKFTVLAPTYKVTIKSGENTAGLGGGTYHAGDSVTVQTVSMATGYVFAGWTAAGIELDAVQEKSPSFTFTMPEGNVALTPSYIYTITNIALAIDKPTKDSVLDTNAGYTITKYNGDTKTSETEPLTVVWTPADTKAKGNTEYKALVVLKPNYAEGFVFDDSVTAAVAGASSTSCGKNDDGSVTVYAVFPATEKVKLESITAPDEMYLNNLTYYYSELMSILPKSVDIKTDDGTRTAAVWWDISPMRDLWPLLQYSFGIGKTQEQLTGYVTLPDDVDANDIELKTTITLKSHAVIDSAEIPIPDITPGTYSESKQLNFDIKNDWSKVKEIRYTTDGTEPSASSGEIYTKDSPIALDGTAGESKTITVKVMAVGSGSYSNSAVQAYKYTIDLPAEKETVTVTNGLGSGEYNNGDKISIIAQPKSGKAFKNWIAEAVTYTTTERKVTETILDENGDEKEVTTTKTETTRNARTIDGCFADASKPVTTFTVPKVESGEIIEITAQCADAVTAVNLKADIPSYGGDMPSAMTTSTDGVTVSNFAVTPNDAAAAENTQYTMAVKVCANESYAFGETPVFTVNGTTAAGNPNTDGTYTVVYTFKTGARERFSGVDATGTKSEYHDSNKGDWADSYYAEINTAVFSIPTALKWTVTNNESRTADVPFEAPSISGKGVVRFGFIITGTEAELSNVDKVELNVQ